MSEASFIVIVSETEVVHHRPEGKVERVALAELKAVLIETNDAGPWSADLWWILLGSGLESDCVFPGGATGEQDVLERLQQLPGFDNEAVIKAMGSTHHQRFLCWQAKEE